MGIELVAHAKSLMTGRYIIPYIVGYACLIVLLGYHYFKKDSFRRRVYTGGLCLLLLLQVPAAYSGARDYAYEGKMTAIYFQAIMDRVPQDGVIIAAIEDEELDLSTASWLEVHGWTQVFYYDRNTEELTAPGAVSKGTGRDAVLGSGRFGDLLWRYGSDCCGKNGTEWRGFLWNGRVSGMLSCLSEIGGCSIFFAFWRLN